MLLGYRMSQNEWITPPRNRIGVYGWRKRCIYALILALLAIVIINFALTLWIIKTMEFNVNGMGELWIVPNGVKLSGKAYVLGSLFSSNIRSHPQKSITLQDVYNITLNSRNESGYIQNFLYLDYNKTYTNANQFIINDLQGKSLFSVNKEEVVVGAKRLRVTGIADFKGSVQTPLVQSCEESELRLESPSRKLELAGALGIWIRTKKDLSTSSLNNVKMDSLSGEILLKSQNVYLPMIKTFEGGHPLLKLEDPEPWFSKSTFRNSSATHRKIFQACACQNGKIFLALQDGNCVTKQKDCL